MICTIWPQVFRMLLRRIKRQISVSGCENVWWVDKTTWCQLFLPGGKWLGGGFAEQRTLPWTVTPSAVLSLVLSACPLDIVQEWDKLPTAVLWTSFQGWKLRISNSWKQRLVSRAIVKRISQRKRDSLVLWSGSPAAVAKRNRATVQSPLLTFHSEILSTWKRRMTWTSWSWPRRGLLQD